MEKRKMEKGKRNPISVIQSPVSCFPLQYKTINKTNKQSNYADGSKKNSDSGRQS